MRKSTPKIPKKPNEKVITEKPKRKINARQKGHTYERKIAEEFRQLGYTECLTSRLESKRQDDLGIDLCHTGMWAVQCKAVEKLGSYHDILKSMPQHDKINVLFHKRNNKGETVTMSKNDFYKIVEILKQEKI